MGNKYKGILAGLVFLAAASASLGQNIPAYVPSNGLVAWYPFNGNANDESGNGNNGNLVGGVSGTLDRFGNLNSAFLFNGIDGHIEIPSLDNQPYTPITYSAWVIVNSYFPSSFGHKFRSIIGRNTGFVLDNGVIGFYADNNNAGGIYDNTFLMWRGGGNSGPAPFSDSIPVLNTWLHVTYTQTILGDWKWYLNGVLTNSGNFTDAQNDFNYFQIGGCNNSTGNFYWNDKLDDIGLWNRALSPAEIQALYTGTVNNNPNSAYINNRNCVVCDQYAVGDTFSLDSGATWYTVVDRALLEQKRDAGDDLSKVCVSLVTDMSSIFLNKTYFNQDISNWDISNVTNVSFMFAGSSFNHSIGNWDVSNVLSMRSLFEGTPFNQDISYWDVSSVVDMAGVFLSTPFNHSIGNWDVSSVLDMSFLFYGSAFNQDISGWNVSNVIDMSRMFLSSPFNHDIGNWDVSNVVDMDWMFYSANLFNQDLSEWCVTNISSLPYNFSTSSALSPSNHPVWGTCPTAPIVYNPNSAYVNNRNCVVCDQYAVGDTFSLDSGATWYTVVDRALLEQKRDAGDDLSKVCVSLVTDMSNLFQAKSAFNDNISGWDVSNVTDMEYMFLDAQTFNDTIGNWDVSNVNNMAFMFKGAHAFDQNLNQWDVSAVSNMRQLFFGASSFNSPIDLWNVSGVINMQGMFQGAAAFNQPIGAWEVASVTNMNSMFYNTYAFDQDLTGWCVSNISSLPTNFAGNSALQSMHYPQWGSCPCNIVLDLGPDTVAVCGSSYTLDAGAGFDSYLWNTGDTTQSIVVSSSGLYYCTVANATCAITDSINVNLLDIAVVASSNSICAGQEISLSILDIDSVNNQPPSIIGFDYQADYGNTHVYTSQSAMSWHQALALTQSLGGSMAIIRDANENAFFNGIITSLPNSNWWLGATDELNEGTWVWVDGSPMGYSNWHIGEPNNAAGTQHYLQMYQGGTWDDYYASSTNFSFRTFLVVPRQQEFDFLWSTGDTTASITANPSQTTTYYCTVSDGISTCTDSITVYVNSPVVDLGADTLSVCGQDSVLLDAGAGHSSYLWNTGETTQTIYAYASGTYSVEVSDGTPSSNSSSLSFDGVDDFIDLTSSSANLTGALTYMGYISVSSLTNYSGIIGRGEGTSCSTPNKVASMLMLNNNGNLFWEISDNAACNRIESKEVIIPNQWYFVAATWDGSNNSSSMKIFVNGVLDTSGSSTISAITQNTSSDNVFRVGNRDLGFTGSLYGFFNGEIDDVSIFDYALTQSEIQQYMSCPPTGSEAGLVGYWNFEEGSGSIANDLSGNGNHGTINGATWSNNVPSQSCGLGCTATDSVYVNFLDASITISDSVVCTGDSVTLSAGGGMGSASSSSLPAYLPTNGLVAWYPFNGNANDESGNGNNGTVYGATLTTDRDGNATSSFDFDGADDYIEIPSSTQFDQIINEITISLWFKSNTFANNGTLVARRNFVGNPNGERHHFELTIMNTGIIHFSALDNSNLNQTNFQFSSPAGTISINQWTHLVGVYSNVTNDFVVYIDGIETFRQTLPSGQQLSPNGHWINFGRIHRSGGNPFFNAYNGLIDDVALYNRALSASEIQSLYSANTSNLSYNWSTGDTTATITANPTQTTTYYCTVSDGISTCTDSITVYVSPLPALDLGLDTVAVCGSSYTLDAGAGFDQYQWNTGDTSQTIVVNQSGSYTVTATINGSCSAIDSVYVHLLNIPIEASSSAICAGSSVELAARYVAGAIAPAPAMPGFTYHGIYKEQYIYASNSATSWPSARQACLSRGGDLIVIRDAGENTDYYAMASQYFGNLGSWIGLTDEAQEGVWTWVDGSLLGYSNWASGEPNNFGGNEDYANFTTSGQWNDRGSRNLYYLMAIPVQVASYAWSTGDSIPAISVSPTQTTTYYCTISDGIATCTDSVTIQVTPVPAFDLGTDTLALCGTRTTLDAGSGFDSYLWSTGDTTQSIVVEASGNYSCMVTLQSCTLTDSIQVILQGVEINAFLSTITTWRQMGMDIDGELAGDRFGVNVSLSADGSRLAAGAHFNDGNGNFSGHTRVFNWDGANWVQMGSDIDGEAAGDRSGVSVSLSANGNCLAIGAYQNDGNGSNAGQTRIFEWNGSSWNQLGADIDGEAANDWAGWSVSLSGDGTRVAIGAFQNDGNGADAGHARVYEWDGSQWFPMGSDLDGEAAGDGAGASVALSSDGSRLAVGAYKDDDGGLDAGSVQVYQWDGSSWLPLGGRLHGEGAEDYFGWSTDLSANGQRLAVGAYQNDGNGSNAGHTRVFEWDGSAWQQLGNDIDGEAAGDFSGISVALTNDGQSVAVGAHQNDGSATNAGHARLYRWDGSQWNTVSTDIDGEAAGDLSGHSIAIAADGLRLASGARVNAGSGLAAGHVRVYSLDTYWDPFSGTPRNQLVCSGDSIALEAMTDAIAGTRFLWSTGDTTSSITIAPNQSGTYSCLVSNGSFSCVDSIRVDIASPSLDLGPDTVIICGSSYTLDAGPGLETYQWSTGGANQMLTVSRSGWYSCTVTQSGCTVRDSIYVHLLNASITASSACVSLGDSVSVSAISTSGLPLRYLWSTGDTTQTIWVTPTQQTALSCVVSDGITNCTAATIIQLGDWQPQATLLDNSYTTRFTWPTRNTARYNLHLREIGQSSWTNYVQTGLTKNLRNLEPGEYEFYVTAYNSIISGVDTSCMGYFTQECADISYSYNAFQAPELGRLGRVRVFGTQGGKRLYDIHLVNQEGDSTSVYNARQSNFTQLKDGRYTIYVQDDLGCSSDSIARFVIDPIDTTRVPYLIGAPNNPPNGFRPTWNSVDGIINYQLRVLNVTDGTLQDFVTGITDTNYAITNLPTGKLYRFNVRSRYNKGISVVNSGYSNPVSRNLPLTGNKGGHSSPTTLVEHGAQWLVYPNPTDGKLYVQAPLGSQLVLVDMNGKRLAESTVVATEEMLDLSVLAQGVYLLQIIHQDQVHQERIVKQ